MLLMAQADISVVTEQQLPMVVELYNQTFRPPETEEYFRRRFQGRYNVLVMLASLDQRPVGFTIGFELKPFVFYIWLTGVHPDFRRKGVGLQLIESQSEWAKNHGYEYIRFEGLNSRKSMIHLALEAGFDVMGTRWDSMRSDLMIQFEKALAHEMS
jgi:GNAT superfamily N-acetyltransferase